MHGAHALGCTFVHVPVFYSIPTIVQGPGQQPQWHVCVRTWVPTSVCAWEWVSAHMHVRVVYVHVQCIVHGVCVQVCVHTHVCTQHGQEG